MSATAAATTKKKAAATPTPVAKKAHAAPAAKAKHTAPALGVDSRGLGARPTATARHKRLSAEAKRRAQNPMLGVPKVTLCAIMASQGVLQCRASAVAALRQCTEHSVLTQLRQALILCQDSPHSKLTAADIDRAIAAAHS